MKNEVSPLWWGVIVALLFGCRFSGYAGPDVPLRTVVPTHRKNIPAVMPGEKNTVSGHAVYLDLRAVANHPLPYNLLRLNYE